MIRLLILLCCVVPLIVTGSVTHVNAARANPSAEALAAIKAVVEDAKKTREEKIKAVNDVASVDAEIARGLVQMYLTLKTRDGEGRVAFAVLHAIARVTDVKERKALREDLVADAVDIMVRKALFQAVANGDDEDTVKYVLKTLDEDRATMRLLAANWCGRKTLAPAFDKMIALLQDGSWRVRSSAIEALAKYATSDAPAYRERVVNALIQLMQEETGRLVEDCARALRTISGEDYGNDPFAWESWRRRSQGKEPGGAGSGRGRTSAGTYDIESCTHQMIFVIDTSISMNEEIDPELRKEAESVTGRRKQDDKRKDIDWSKIKTKLDLARAELTRTIEALPADMWFTIISYSTDVHPWKEEIVPADAKNKGLAVRFLEELSCDKLTNIFGAFDAAIVLSEKAFDDASGKRHKKDKTAATEQRVADTIYFLTDGYATTGKYRGPDNIVGKATPEQAKQYTDEMNGMCDEIIDRNEVARMTIHTIGIGQHDQKTLKKLAALCNGSYVSIGAKKK